ncbi:uncharacterized protein LOC116342958 isoform X2 [Contarinia nasturtii]|uniref:uncharacterized protein LOC116342958 isoform X2 n=1 Tax=Contarinia nasturtii TaxID=265458 RepID=UPI0012D4A347|nr:uncharacterized protein LOC116342958 isoform X2 [Contarinia nasturtii]
MAMLIKSKVHTVIFSIILIVLENWGTANAQQQPSSQQQLQQTKDQNFYYQSPQRFQSAFPASRNGFFPTNGLPNFAQNLPQSLPRSQLGGAIQQPAPQQQQQQQFQQSPQQDQSAFFGAVPTKNDGSTADYFQYTAFPQQTPRQQENFFQISPRPFAIQPNGNHGLQFVRPPIVPQSQQYTADQNNNQFPFPQQSFPQQQQSQQLLLSNDGNLDQQRQPIALQQQSLAHQNGGRSPTITIYDATKFVKQGQASRLLNDSTANRNSNNNSIKNSVRKSNESITSQENSNENNRFPITRNRFHPLSTTKQPSTSRIAQQITTPTSTTTTTPATDLNPTITLDQRQNRIPISSRFGTSREQNTSVRINKFLRQPIFTSRENIQQTIKRINITHNGSANRDGGSTSQEVSNRTHQLQLLQQARQKIRESSGETVKAPLLQQGIISKLPQKTIIEQRPSIEANEDDDEEEEFFYEDDDDEENQGQEEIRATPKPKDEQKPVILTSNFFLPGKPIPKLEHHDFETQEPNDLSSDISEVNAQQKDKAEDVIDSVPEVETEKFLETTTTKKLDEKPTKTTTTTQAKPVIEDPDVEYEYEYDYIDEPTTTTTTATTEAKVIQKPTTVQVDQTTVNIADDNDHNGDDEDDDEQQTTIESDDVPEITIRTEEKTFKSNTSSGKETSSVSDATVAAENTTSMEGYVVVASVQTSRSISDARYITFPQVIQEERRQSLSDLGKDMKKFNKDDDYNNNNESTSDDSNKDDDVMASNEENTTTTEEIDSTETSQESFTQSQNESDSHQDIVKTRVHKLSSISEKLAHLHELNEPKAEITTKSIPVVIRKFTPRTTKAPTRKPTSTTAPSKRVNVDDELASLLPPGFKYRAHSLSESTTKPTTPAETTSTTVKSDTVKDDIIAKKIQFKEISLEDLLPKDYKPPSESKPKAQNGTKNGSDTLVKIKFDDNIEALLPKDYKPYSTTPSSATKAPFRLSTVTEDIGKLLPPGYKQPKESFTTKRPLSKTTMDDISKFLPPGFKLPKFTTTEKTTTSADNNSGSSIENVLNKLSFNADISSLLPPGYKANASVDDLASAENKEETSSPQSTSTSTSPSNNKFGFLKGIGKRPGVRLTTPRPSHGGAPTPPKVTIRSGLPTRATTEFTGWPTVSTTPLSVQKIIEQQGAQAIDISEILKRTSSSTSTTVVTTTTTTTTVRPTQPGTCHVQCDLAGTIKIVDGVKWKPELLDHNTVEYKNLAKEIETQLNNVYSKADRLRKWYKKIRIDSFSQGSVLVDYFVELADVSRDINTQEIKQMFHDALTEVPMTVVPLKNNATASSNMDMEQIIADFPDNTKPARSNYLMGHFILDPLSTDFIVIPKQRTIPTIPNEIEQNAIIPQWAIAVIVIGAGSLLFVVIFGAAVLMNRQKRSKKKAPVPLTADMLNELNKNHMGGFENYGHEELYIEDTWDDVKPDFKPKRFANSSSDRDERFDSWRTQQKYQANADYYYDQKLTKPHYSQKTYAYPPQTDPYMENYHPHYHPSYASHHHPSHQNAMGLYTYNTRRYNRDYDPDF